jgi:hypothetical protein
MDWQAHINNIIHKVAYKMSNLKRLQYKLPRSALERIYLTMIRPVIEYSNIVYDNLTIKQSDQLEHIQRRAALICTGAYRHTEHRKLLSELGWETLASRRKVHRLITYYKLSNGLTPAHIIPLMAKPVSAHTSYNLRNKNNLRTPQNRLKISKGSYFPQTIKDWNNLPIETRASLTVHSFKAKIQPPIPKKLYINTHYGKGGVWLARIRMGLSGLNSHRFTYNHINSPSCTTCNKGSETPLHYFWACTNHTPARNKMMEEIREETGIQASRNNILNILLYGKLDRKHHKTIFKIASTYLAETKRFK